MLYNTFSKNSGTKGIVYLDFYEREETPVYFVKNSFEKNAGYLDSNVFHIRARGNAG